LPKDAFWLRHDANASSDMKLRRLRSLYYSKVKAMIAEGKVDEGFILALASWAPIGWYWYMIEQLREQGGYH